MVTPDMKTDAPHDGGCACGAVRYRMAGPPLFVHACHCTWCQRETGGPCAVNALIETDRVRVLQGAPAVTETPSASGAGQQIVRCPDCKVALWSHYALPRCLATRIAFVRAGTLDAPNACPPDIHIFTYSKQDWVVFPNGALVMPGYYRWQDHWPADSLARWQMLRQSLKKGASAGDG